MKQLPKALFLVSNFLLAIPFSFFFKTSNPIVSDPPGKGTTRAVIIGISEYQNEGNDDLRFAHRDAQIFYDFLLSKAGGEVLDSNIRLLINENATVAAIDDAVYWLNEHTKKGDKVIFYFSGHGKVEKPTLLDHGFLIAANSPPNNLLHNAIRIEDLDEFAKTWSADRDAKVVFIIDACRSGKMANTGFLLTDEAQRERQAVNEVRILSCKSSEKSLEDEMWGQGRGLFSYYLVNGLKGMADTKNDGIVSLEELKSYLKQNMQTAIEDANIDQRQTPVFVGEDESFELAEVDVNTKLALQQELSQTNNEPMAMASTSFGSIAGKGHSEEDEKRLRQDQSITTYLRQVNFDELINMDALVALPANNTDILPFLISQRNTTLHFESETMQAGYDAFNALAQKALVDRNSSTNLSHKLAIELHNRAQTAINLYLSGDAETIAMRQLKDRVSQFSKYPAMLKAAMSLIEPDHPLYQRIKVNFQYFSGVAARLNQQVGNPSDDPLEIQLKALEMDDKVPYIHNELGIIYLQANDLENAKKQFEIAADLAPSWALPPSNLSIVFSEQNKLEQATASAKKAIELQPDFFGPYTTLGKIAMDKKNFLHAEAMYKKAIERNKDYYLAYEEFAKVCLATTRYDLAEQNFATAESLKPNAIPPPMLDIRTAASLSVSANGSPITADDSLYFNPKTVEEFMKNGEIYFKAGSYDGAEKNFRSVIKFEPDHPKVYESLGLTLLKLGRYEEAMLSFEKLLPLRPDEPGLELLIADVYQKQGRWLEEEKIYQNLIEDNRNPNPVKKDAHLRLIELVDKQQRYWEEEQLMVEFETLYGNSNRQGRASFYKKMVELHPGNLDWLNKQANYYREIGSDYYASEIFEQILQKDSIGDGAGFMHATIGSTNNNDKAAIAHFQAAMRLMPGLSSPKFHLARIYHRQWEFDKEVSVLEDLLRNKQIDLKLRLQLADLYMLAGRYDQADTLLMTANKIKFDEVDGLNELRGKLEMLRGNPQAAITFYEKELAFHTENVNRNYCYTIAKLHARSGNQAAALAWLTKALSNDFRYSWVLKYDSDWGDYRKEPAFAELLKTYHLESDFEKDF
ncbi:MAG: tetratricopeptide repeat protein [Saprospiraceae bacterium]|nr:tetratricopeptide repeat protein [Saprospiraceae bacterium]MCF8251344.1 tetratricopeptide repeat protein [Saprospiraceae bacterium]MCF8280519.1 tetratricopeptide repeat protein [Bacteroidales bacterium]MCF8313263.1 tetratricopeptide repeat protein [Saprospiraceae bacterium]MCF8441710.1 tetratricopeptide repeat protein [Saprospiraceae bacterium]